MKSTWLHVARLPRSHRREHTKKEPETRRGSGEGSYAEEFPRQDYLHEHVIFMSMFNDIDLNRAGDEQMYIINAQRDVDLLQDFTIQIIGASSGTDLSSLGTTTRLEGTREKWDAIAEGTTDIC